MKKQATTGQRDSHHDHTREFGATELAEIVEGVKALSHRGDNAALRLIHAMATGAMLSGNDLSPVRLRLKSAVARGLLRDVARAMGTYESSADLRTLDAVAHAVHLVLFPRKKTDGAPKAKWTVLAAQLVSMVTALREPWRGSNKDKPWGTDEDIAEALLANIRGALGYSATAEPSSIIRDDARKFVIAAGRAAGVPNAHLAFNAKAQKRSRDHKKKTTSTRL